MSRPTFSPIITTINTGAVKMRNRAEMALTQPARPWGAAGR
jgi:hypothetical protein